MQVIENATNVRSRLLECRADPTRSGWLQLTVEVSETSPVPDLPSLVSAVVGDRLTVLVGPADRMRAQGLRPGTALDMQVRLRAPGLHTAVPESLHAE